MFLYNRVNREELINRLHREKFKRTTLSFYRYFLIDDPQGFRDHIYARWLRMDVFGRICVAREGINAQLSLPEKNLERFVAYLDGIPGLENMPLKHKVPQTWLN